MAKIYHDEDADLGFLKEKKICIVGYGSQGHAHALNLRDSGLNVVVALPEWDKDTWKRAESDGMNVVGLDKIEGDLIAMLIPDMVQPEVYRKFVKDKLKPGSAILFAHGFNIHYNQIIPPSDVDVIMVA
ncbi:MAG: ketol-acid reductoisomerase, partial [Archaeoglobaceae archaeon]